MRKVKLIVHETYQGSTLVADKTATDAMYFHYDQNGSVIGFTYDDGTTSADYYYVKNLQGDILGILDASGALVASYTYDAWGNVLTVGGSNTTLASRNPIRYRGYYYDTESELYYLQSRYYDAAIGRFINADGYAQTYESGIGANMFIYCMDNPVHMIEMYVNYPVYVVKTINDECSDGTNGKIEIEYIVYDTEASLWGSNGATQTEQIVYTVNDGTIRVPNMQKGASLLAVPEIAYAVADVVMNRTQLLHQNSLNGRTTAGVGIELFLHVVAYKADIKTNNTDFTDIGALSVEDYGYDYNAWWFEVFVQPFNALKEGVVQS